MAVDIDLAYTESDVGPEVYHTTVTYVLKDTKAEELNEVSLLVKAPNDKNGEPLGEDLSVDIPVSKPN